MSRLREIPILRGRASPRRIEALVTRFVDTGFLEVRGLAGDDRVRILKPTEKMLRHDRDWLAAWFAPLAVVRDSPGYAPALERAPWFQMAQRRTAPRMYARSEAIMALNPEVSLFMGRDSGFLVLAALVGDVEGAGSFTALSRRFGVSRTHVRTLLNDAATAGLVRLEGRGGRRIELTPRVRAAFDRFLSESMAAHDLTCQMAWREHGA